MRRRELRRSMRSIQIMTGHPTVDDTEHLFIRLPIRTDAHVPLSLRRITQNIETGRKTKTPRNTVTRYGPESRQRAAKESTPRYPMSWVQKCIQEFTKMFMSGSAKIKPLNRDNFVE